MLKTLGWIDEYMLEYLEGKNIKKEEYEFKSMRDMAYKCDN
jgi:hypothetical protein